MVSEQNKRLLSLIQKSDLSQYKNLNNYLQVILNIFQDDKEEVKFCLSHMRYIKQWAEYVHRKTGQEEFGELYYSALLFEAPHLLDSFLLYMEKDRPAKERFYLPRRRVMLPLVEAIQRLADNELDELFLHMPARVGKTAVLTFTNIWWANRHPEESNLYTAFSDTITRGFYDGCMELMTDPTYCFADIFPMNTVVATNSKEETIDINRKKKYKSITSRSIYGTLNGACDCSGLMLIDDIVVGIEDVLNPERLNRLWSIVDNNLITRGKSGSKKLWCGTIWSVADPFSRRMDLLQNDPKFAYIRYEVIKLPALDQNDESNFDYDYGVGFNTAYYQMRRASFEKNNDMASWYAQFQQEPIEREGSLFTPSTMRFYNGILPSGEPDRIFMAIDPAWGGGDFVSGPICYQYGNEYYIADVVFDEHDKTITRPRIVEKVLKHCVNAAQFEANNGGDDYKEWIENELLKRGYRLNITSRRAPTNKAKEARIFDRAPEIREMYFLEDGKRSKEYQMFMQNIFSYKINGKNKNDDGPDSLAQLCEMILRKSVKTYFVDSPF